MSLKNVHAQLFAFIDIYMIKTLALYAEFLNNNFNVNTVRPTAIVYAGEPTTSEDTYAASGDADAESKLFVALKDDTNNATFIARLTINGVFET